MGHIFNREDYNEGYDEGHADGYEAGSAAMNAAIARLVQNSAELIEKSKVCDGKVYENVHELIAIAYRQIAVELEGIQSLGALDREIACSRSAPR